MYRKPSVKFAYLALILWLFLTACAAPVAEPAAAPASSGDAGSASQAAEETFLLMQLLSRSDGEEQAIRDGVAEVAEALGVVIQITFVSGGEASEKFRVAYIAGTAPDIVELANSEVSFLRQDDLLAPLEGVSSELTAGAAIFEATPYSLPWLFDCGRRGLSISSASSNYSAALEVVYSLAVPVEGPCPIANAGREEWIPYPDPPEQAVIGDATLVPGDFVIRDGVRKLDDILASEEATINVARPVMLSDDQGSTRLAPVWNSLEPKEDNDVIIGVTVIEGDTSELDIPPGVYAVRSVNHQVELESPDGERFYPEMLDLTDNPFQEFGPTAGIDKGSRTCRCCIFGWCFTFRCG